MRTTSNASVGLRADEDYEARGNHRIRLDGCSAAVTLRIASTSGKIPVELNPGVYCGSYTPFSFLLVLCVLDRSGDNARRVQAGFIGRMAGLPKARHTADDDTIEENINGGFLGGLLEYLFYPNDRRSSPTLRRAASASTCRNTGSRLGPGPSPAGRGRAIGVTPKTLGGQGMQAGRRAKAQAVAAARSQATLDFGAPKATTVKAAAPPATAPPAVALRQQQQPMQPPMQQQPMPRQHAQLQPQAQCSRRRPAPPAGGPSGGGGGEELAPAAAAGSAAAPKGPAAKRLRRRNSPPSPSR